MPKKVDLGNVPSIRNRMESNLQAWPILSSLDLGKYRHVTRENPVFTNLMRAASSGKSQFSRNHPFTDTETCVTKGWHTGVKRLGGISLGSDTATMFYSLLIGNSSTRENGVKYNNDKP